MPIARCSKGPKGRSLSDENSGTNNAKSVELACANLQPKRTLHAAAKE